MERNQNQIIKQEGAHRLLLTLHKREAKEATEQQLKQDAIFFMEFEKDNCISFLVEFDRLPKNKRTFRDILIKRYDCMVNSPLHRSVIQQKPITEHLNADNQLKTELQGFMDKVVYPLAQSQKKPSDELINLLNKEHGKNQIAAYLDVGCVEDVLYYGFMLEGKPAIICSNGAILRNTQENFKNKVIGEDKITPFIGDYSGYIGEIAPIIQNQTIKRYYTSGGKKYIEPKAHYLKLRNKILEYMDFTGKDQDKHNEMADVLSCWILATFCYPLFHWYPHLLFNAPKESGKTKCAYLCINLSFRGFDLGGSGGVSPAVMFRTIEGNRGTLLLDEYEQSNMPKENQALVNQILNASASRDSYILRNVPVGNNEWMPKRFPIFCPKIAANISGINETSLSRFISLSWIKTTKDSDKGKRKPQKTEDTEMLHALREENYLFMLEHFQEISQIYSSFQLNHFSNRMEDNWLPLFVIAKFIDKAKTDCLNVEGQLLKFIETTKEQASEAIDSMRDFLEITYEAVTESEYAYEARDIESFFSGSDVIPEYIRDRPKYIGRILKQYFPQIKGKRRKYYLSKEKVRKILDRYYPDWSPQDKEPEPKTEVVGDACYDDTKKH